MTTARRETQTLPSWGAKNIPWVGEVLAASHSSKEELISSKKKEQVLSTSIKYIFFSEKPVDCK